MIKLKKLLENIDPWIEEKHRTNEKIKALERQLETEFPQLQNLDLYA